MIIAISSEYRGAVIFRAVNVFGAGRQYDYPIEVLTDKKLDFEAQM